MTAPQPPSTEQRAREAMRIAGLEPIEPYPGRTNAKWKTRCVGCGNICTPRISNILYLKNAGGCLYCIGRRIPPHEAEHQMQLAGFTPRTPYVRADEKWPSTCNNCGSYCTPTLSDVRHHNVKACRKCRRPTTTTPQPGELPPAQPQPTPPDATPTSPP